MAGMSGHRFGCCSFSVVMGEQRQSGSLIGMPAG